MKKDNINFENWYWEEYSESYPNLLDFIPKKFFNNSFINFYIKVPLINDINFYKELYKDVSNYDTCLKSFSINNISIKSKSDFYISFRFFNNKIIVDGWDINDELYNNWNYFNLGEIK